MEKSEMGTANKPVQENSSMEQVQQQPSVTSGESVHEKKPWWHPVIEPGSAVQIIIAAAIAVGIGLGVKTAHPDIPAAATTILIIPGNLWLRALKAVVLPLIVTAMILAVQKLKDITNGGAALAKWTIGYYVITTIVAIVHSIIMTSQVWARLMTVASAESIAVDSMSEKDKESYEERKDQDIPATVTDLFNSLIPANVVDALAKDHLLAVLVSAVVVGYLLDNRDGRSSIIKAVREIETLIMIIITFLIKLAPIGVFFLILPNMFKLDINDIGVNLGILIGGSISSMFMHLFVILPIIFFAFTRQNPYKLWLSCSPAWLTAWGTASSAATLSVTMRCTRETLKVPVTVTKFAVPLGCLINMDGTAIYFPIVVVFLAQTQGHVLNAADYIIILLLSTLASIGTTPIPSSSLVLTVMIASSVGIPPSGMYGVVVAIDWFIDRFRTATNVSGDLFAAVIVQKMTGITDPEDGSETEETEVRHNDERV